MLTGLLTGNIGDTIGTTVPGSIRGDRESTPLFENGGRVLVARIKLNRGDSSEPSRSRKARNIFVVGALTLVSTIGGVVAANNAVSDPAPGQNLTICHRTNSNTNPYVIESPNINATGLHGGHITHTGPIWDPTLKSKHIKWGDIIPAFDYTDKGGITQHFPGLNDDAEGAQILANGCNIPNTVVPGTPTVTQSVCNSDHNATVPDITLPTTPGITYTTNPPAPYFAGEGDVVITATADAPANWFQSPGTGGWSFVDQTHETFTVHIDAAPNCKTTVVPENPTVVQSVCAGDPASPTVPTITLATTAGITYTTDKSAPFSTGEVVVVTAHANSGAGDQFVSPAPAGWTFVNATTETFTVTLDDAPDCTAPASGVTPTAPTLTEPSCVGDPSQLVPPSLTLPSGPSGVTYSASVAGPYAGGQSVTITATADATHTFSSPGMNGWTFVDSQHETLLVAFDASPTCSGKLADTGVNSRQLIEGGSIILLFGLGFQFLSMGMRRRPTA